MDFYWGNLFRSGDDKNSRVAELWLKTPLFSGLGKNTVLSLVRDLHLREFDDGEIIFADGDRGLGAVLVLSGTVQIKVKEKVLAELKTGDVFGEVALAGDETRTADAYAAGKSELAFFLRPQLEILAKRHPEDATVIYANLAKILSERLRAANKHEEQREGKIENNSLNHGVN